MSTFRNYDAWLTREPDYPERPLSTHCSRCGGFLALRPYWVVSAEDGLFCDGQVKTYPIEHSDIVVDIIGEENRFGTIEVTDCEWEWNPVVHDPHFSVQYTWDVEYRKCSRCGYLNQEVQA